jgi:hypothetical protein
MTDRTLNCRMSDGDYMDAYVDSDGDIRVQMFAGGDHIYASPADFAEWARQIIADAGEPTTGATAKIGDKVTVTSPPELVGTAGILDKIDIHDSELPYRIVDEDGKYVAWAHRVRRTGADGQTSDSSFTAHVEEAKRLLEGTTFRGEDVIILARELADRA